MISIKSAFSRENLLQQYDIGYYGAEIDERTKYSIGEICSKSNHNTCVKYNPENLTISLNKREIQCEDIPSEFASHPEKKICIDSTSLDVPELALLLKALIENKVPSFDILYVEPESYVTDPAYSPSNSEFELSDQILGFESAGIPTITKPIPDEIKGPSIFFAGFESERLASAFETFEFYDEMVSVIFGVPSFRPGWETISFKNNLTTLRENSIQGRVEYCSASCPGGAIKKIRQIIGDSGFEGEAYITPLGTKPNSIAALLYSLETETTIIYDHPQKKPGRSKGIGTRNLYRVAQDHV